MKRKWALYLFVYIIIMFSLNTVTYAALKGTSLSVAFCVGMPPYQFLEKNQPKGMHIDLLNQIAQDNKITLKYIPYTTNSECISALEDGEVDLILGVVLSDITSTVGNLSSEISTSSICILKPKDIVLEHYSNVAFEYRTSTTEVTRQLKAYKYYVAPNQKELFQMLINKKVDAIAGVRNCIEYQLQQYDLKENYQILSPFLDNISYGIAVDKSNIVLLNTINKGITSIKLSEKYEEIYNNWVVPQNDIALLDYLKKYSLYLSFIVLAVITYVYFSRKVNAYLKNQVAQQSQSLIDINEELKDKILQIQLEGDFRNRIIENSESAMLLFDQNYIITYCNSKSVELLKCPNNLINTNILDISLTAAILAGLTDKIFAPNFTSLKSIYRSSDGTVYRYNIYKSHQNSVDYQGIINLEDITKEDLINQKAFDKEKNKALNHIVAGIAHEIRNPLMSIRTFAALLEKKWQDEDFKHSFSQFVPREVDRINTLIQGLIDYARPIKGKRESVAVKELIDNCLYLVQAAKLSSKINFTLDLFQSENSYIFVNKNQVTQVLINLIINAKESIEKKIELDSSLKNIALSITATESQDNIIIYVTDYGIGMTHEQLQKCTQPFYTTKNTGTGIGLAVSKQYIEENGGTLKIESEKNIYTKIEISFRKVIK